ncbi:hypothetical protein ES703_100168 [subsurface metagenome]
MVIFLSKIAGTPSSGWVSDNNLSSSGARVAISLEGSSSPRSFTTG